jgi:acetolactate decarboxylase
MGLDPSLAAAVTLRRSTGVRAACGAHDGVFQLTLAHVLLDGGYDGVTALADVLPSGDHGLGTVDRLDGELVVVDGEPWRVDATGAAALVPPTTRTPFVVLTNMERATTTRLRDTDRDGLLRAIDALVPDTSAVVAVRLEGRFRRVLVRSVPAQRPPYRPYAEVCRTDEVRWEHHDFDGVFVGFRFPDLGTADIIAGLHLHGLDTARTTGGHNHELHVDDAALTVSVAHDIALALPDRGMVDLLEMDDELRAVQRALLRRGPLTLRSVAGALDIDLTEAQRRLDWLTDRGHLTIDTSGLAGLGGPPRWRMSLHTKASRIPSRAAALLADL